MKIVVKIFRALRWRPVTVAYLFYLFIFFNVFLPVHTRGIVTMSGKYTGGCPWCCCGHSPSTQHVPTPQDRKNCAICNFAARVMPPEIFYSILPKLGLLELLPLPAPAAPSSFNIISTYHSRGPPARV